MEDIERLKKISEMSRELRKHGIAVDSEDALKQSEEIYQAERPNLEVDKDLSVKHGVQTETGDRMASSEEFGRFVNSVNERMNKVEENVSSVIGKINEMIKEINRFEARLDSNGVAQTPKEQQTKIEAPQPEKTGETQAQSRAGDYKPGDVEIDKIFYFGNR